MNERLLKIAKEASVEVEERGDLEYRYNDEEDYLELSVGAIQALLEKAYELGRKEAKAEAK